MFKKRVSWSYSFWSETQVQGQLWDTGLGEKEDNLSRLPFSQNCMEKGLLVVDLDLARLLIKVSDKPVFTEIPRTSADMLRRGQMDVHLPSEKSVWLCGRVLLQGSDLKVYLHIRSSLLRSRSFSCAQVQACMYTCTHACGCMSLCVCSIIMDY